MRLFSQIKRLAVVSFVLLVVFLLAPVVSYGLTVTNLLDDGSVGSLREVISSTPAWGVDFVVVGTITLTMGEIPIDESPTITGPGADMITIDADNLNRIFNIDDSTVADIVVSISGLMFINGTEVEGGAILNRENLSIDSCVFENNSGTVVTCPPIIGP